MAEMDRKIIKNQIQVAFARLIGPLTIMAVLDSYKSEHDEIKKLINIIVNWGAKFELEGNLKFINSADLLNVYQRIDNLNTKFLYDSSLGDECFLSDEIAIWIWEIMELRKNS